MKYLRALALGIVVIAVAGPARAQLTQLDMAGRNTVPLSSASLLRLRDATQRLVTLVQGQPALGKRVPGIPGPDDKLDAAVELVRATPPVLEALDKSGLEPKTYLQDLASYGQALTVRETRRIGGPTVMPGLVRDNARTLSQNTSLAPPSRNMKSMVAAGNR